MDSPLLLLLTLLLLTLLLSLCIIIIIRKYQQPSSQPLPATCRDSVIAAATTLPAAKKKRGKKKKKQGLDGGDESEKKEGMALIEDKVKECVSVSSPFPFSSGFASATQRKIKVQYDQLVKSNQDRALSMDQVGQFVNCLVEARNELQHKSQSLQRSFKIKKALLFKADRSSFDRLCQQIYKLETEHKRLEEDAAVYNLLQEQLKLSPAYKTMLEVGSRMELKGSTEESTEFSDISFEELLAQEKKDSFWRKNGKLRSFASGSV